MQAVQERHELATTTSELVPWSTFGSRLSKLWSSFDLQPNEGLSAVWKQLHSELERAVHRGREWARVYNAWDIAEESEKSPHRWTVLTPETGTGKTKGVEVYCSLLPATVGATVVVELIEAAEAVAKSINRMAGDKRALAYHSEMEEPIDAARASTYQVLVMTHSAFTRHLEDHAIQQHWGHSSTARRKNMDRWNTLERWNGELRQLTVIDECFPVFGFAELRPREVAALLNELPESVWDDLAATKRCLEFLVQLLRNAEAVRDGYQSSGETMPPRIWWQRGAGNDWSMQDPQLVAAIQEFLSCDPNSIAGRLPFDETKLSWLSRSADQTDISRAWKGDIRATISAAQALLRRFILLTPGDGKAFESIFSTSWTLLPNNAPPLLILDATGKTNPAYRLLRDRITVLDRPAQARRYHNVSLFVERMDVGLGKNSSNRKAEARAKDWFESLSRHCSQPILCVSHKGAKPTLAKYVPTQWLRPLGQLKSIDACLAHWGSFAGTNKFRDLSAIAFFSLPYPPRRNIQLAFNVSQGLQRDEWFSGAASRAFEDWPDVVSASVLRHVVGEIVQAINRTACRKPINDQGDCPPVQVFLPVPRSDFGEALLELIHTHMPGVRVLPWSWKVSKKSHQPNWQAALEVAIRNLEPGRTPANTVKQAVGCGHKRWEKLVAECRKRGKTLHSVCREAKVRYVSEGKGRGARSYFVRERS